MQTPVYNTLIIISALKRWNKKGFFICSCCQIAHMYTQKFSNGCDELPSSKIERQNIVKIILIELVCFKI